MNERPYYPLPPQSEFSVRSVSSPRLFLHSSPWMRFQVEKLLESSEIAPAVRSELLRSCAYQRFVVSPHTFEYHDAEIPLGDPVFYEYMQPTTIDTDIWDVRDRVEGVLFGKGEDANEPGTDAPDAFQVWDERLPSDLLHIHATLLSTTYHCHEEILRLLLRDLQYRVHHGAMRYTYAIEERPGQWDGLLPYGFRSLEEPRSLEGKPYVIFDDNHCPWLR